MPISDHAVGALAGVVLLGGCASPDQPANNRALAAAEAGQRVAADDNGLVLCAQGAAALTRRCSVEQTTTARGLILTLRRPDGGFHRLLATRDGRGLIAADGAETARVAIVGADLIEVTLGNEHYRLPATVRH